jgi:hypothetical protein
MDRYTFMRSSICVETFVVNAESEKAALKLIREGAAEVCRTNATHNWFDDEYTLLSVEDELVTFINSKDTV